MPDVKRNYGDDARSAARLKVGQIAVELFLRQGFEATTADQIAEAAGVSRRTFFRYFATKEEAFFAWIGEVGLGLAKAVTERSPDEPVFTTLRAALQSLVDYAEQDVERMRRLMELTRSAGLFPGLRASKEELWLGNLTAALSAPPRDCDTAGAALYVTAAFLAFDWAMSRWLADPIVGDLGSLLEEAFRVIRSGFTVPRRRSHR